MTKKQTRLSLIGGVFVVATLAVGLTLTALNKAVAYFYSPSALAELETPPSGLIRLGGLVEPGSIVHNEETKVTFKIADEFTTTNVSFVGILPDLFQEGKGVIVQGRVGPGGHMMASEVLAKHDENYMPPEVAQALKEQGRWKTPQKQQVQP